MGNSLVVLSIWMTEQGNLCVIGLAFVTILLSPGWRSSGQLSRRVLFANSDGGQLTVNERSSLFEYWEDLPLPNFSFGEHVKHEKLGKTGKVIGLQWRHNEKWSYCVDYTSLGYGQWFDEDVLTILTTL